MSEARRSRWVGAALLGVALLAGAEASAQGVECGDICPDGTRLASYEAVARGEAGVVEAATCEAFCEPILTCTAPSIPRVSVDEYRCEPLPGYSSIPDDVMVDFGFAAAWDEARALEPPQSPDQCRDGETSDLEAGVDCGGVCLPVTCVDGVRCGDDADCQSGACIGGRCGGLWPPEPIPAGDAAWPEGAPVAAEVVDVGGDGVADVIWLDDGPTLHRVQRGADGAVAAVESWPLAGVQSTLRVRDGAGGVAAALEIRGANVRGWWWPAEGPAIDQVFGALNRGHASVAPVRLDDRPAPTMLAGVPGLGLVPYGFDGAGWTEEPTVGAGRFAGERLDEVLGIAAAEDPAYDDVIVQTADDLWLIARGANGSYPWEAPARLGPRGDGLFAFAARPGGPLDSVGVLHLAPPRRLTLYLTPGAGRRTVELSEDGGYAISDAVGDIDGVGDPDSGRLGGDRLTLTLSSGGPVITARFELDGRYTTLRFGRYDLAGGALVLGPGRVSHLRRALP